ncbi:MAG: glucosaminidase domain-containing protein [Endomicrobium sp.]|jgi:flagellum-specific peptidoglycan hydrolase FlgJ|nr:glucosaminidase domain-containing protein [Endomicrobium sp.]
MNEKRMKEYLEAAKSISETTGFDWLILLTHAYHESGGFDRVIGLNNFWGIKTPTKSNWTGLSKTVLTTEYEQVIEGESLNAAVERTQKKYGRLVEKVDRSLTYKDKWKISIKQNFRDWETSEEAVKWYVDFIKNNYPEAFSFRTDYQNYFKRLVDGKLKYATDPIYAKKCEDLYIALKRRV